MVTHPDIECKMDQFKSLDRVLSLTGCKIFKTTRLSTILNNAQLVVLILASAISICTTVFAALQRPSTKIHFLTYFSLSYISGVLFMLITRSKSQEMRQFLMAVMGRVSAEKRVQLRKTSFRYALFLLSFMFGCGILYLKYAIQYHQHKDSDVITVFGWYAEVYIVSCNRWVLLSCLLVAYLMQVTAAFEQTVLQTLHSRISNGKITVRKSLIVLYELQTQKAVMMPLFSMIPCLVVFYMFIAASGVILQVKIYGTRAKAVVEIATMCLYLVTLWYMTYVGDTCVAAARTTADKIERSMLETGDEKWDRVTDRLRDVTRIPFSCCRLFDINCQFFLTFVSTLITLTALLTQILTSLPA